MAGEWIKMRIDLLNDPAVFRLAKAMRLDRWAIVGRLWALWAWADAHAVDGHVDGATDSEVDEICGRKGFAEALVSVGWLKITEGAIEIPHHEKHNGESAKERSLKNERQAKWRKNKTNPSYPPSTPPSTLVDATQSTDASTREEKRREELTNNTALNGYSIGPDESLKSGEEEKTYPQEFLARFEAELMRAKLDNPTIANPIAARWLANGATPALVANALAEACRARNPPNPITAAFVDPIVERHLTADRDARAGVRRKDAATAATLAESRAAIATRAPRPEHIQIPRKFA